MARSVSPFGMAKLDLPRAIIFYLDSISDDIYLRRIFLSDEFGEHSPDEWLHPTATRRAIDSNKWSAGMCDGWHPTPEYGLIAEPYLDTMTTGTSLSLHQ